MVDDRVSAARLVRIDDLRRCLAGAFQRLRLAADDAEGLALLVDLRSFAGTRTTGSPRWRSWYPATAMAP